MPACPKVHEETKRRVRGISPWMHSGGWCVRERPGRRRQNPSPVQASELGSEQSTREIFYTSHKGKCSVLSPCDSAPTICECVSEDALVSPAGWLVCASSLRGQHARSDVPVRQSAEVLSADAAGYSRSEGRRQSLILAFLQGVSQICRGVPQLARVPVSKSKILHFSCNDVC